MKYENFIYITLEFAHFCPKKGYEIGRRYAQGTKTVHAGGGGGGQKTAKF